MTSETPPTPSIPSPREVAFDWRDWLPHLSEVEIAEEDKEAMIEALWSIVLAFVDLGFEVKSPSETCGEAIDLKAALAAAMVNSTENEEDAA